MSNISNIDFSSDHRLKPMTYGLDFTVYQPKRNLKLVAERRHYHWLCKRCHHRWRGNKNLWMENRKPGFCPRCNSKKIVKERN